MYRSSFTQNHYYCCRMLMLAMLGGRNRYSEEQQRLIKINFTSKTREKLLIKQNLCDNKIFRQLNEKSLSGLKWFQFEEFSIGRKKFIVNKEKIFVCVEFELFVPFCSSHFFRFLEINFHKIVYEGQRDSESQKKKSDAVFRGNEKAC